MEHGENFWYHYRVQDKKFEGWGDPKQLDTLIGVFRSLFEEPIGVGETENIPSKVVSTNGNLEEEVKS